MEIKITASGEYRNDDWQTTEVEAVDHDGQRVCLMLDTDNTWTVESDLIGDDMPHFVGGLSFDAAWRSLATHFGIAATPNPIGE